MLYGTGQFKGVGDAFIRGARSGAAVSGLENIAGALGLTGRDPKSTCGSADPFDLESGLGGSRGYHSQRGNRGGFSLGSFVKDTLTGAVVGGLGSAGFYGAGKAVEALRGSVVGRRSDTDVSHSDMMFRRAKDDSYIEPMPKKQLQRIVKTFRRQGGVIQMNDATDAYLLAKNAEAITLNENTILLRQKPGRASVFEELIHATQFHQGLIDGSVTSRIKMKLLHKKCY